MEIKFPASMLAPRGFMGGKEDLEETFEPTEETVEASQSKQDIIEVATKKQKRAPKVVPERPCPPYLRDNIFRKRSESEDPLGNLRLRARCPDGSLELRHRANKALQKDSKVSDYYDPT
jgi:hypothetical protein